MTKTATPEEPEEPKKTVPVVHYDTEGRRHTLGTASVNADNQIEMSVDAKYLQQMGMAEIIEQTAKHISIGFNAAEPMNPDLNGVPSGAVVVSPGQGFSWAVVDSAVKEQVRGNVEAQYREWLTDSRNARTSMSAGVAPSPYKLYEVTTAGGASNITYEDFEKQMQLQERKDYARELYLNQSVPADHGHVFHTHGYHVPLEDPDPVLTNEQVARLRDANWSTGWRPERGVDHSKLVYRKAMVGGVSKLLYEGVMAIDYDFGMDVFVLEDGRTIPASEVEQCFAKLEIQDVKEAILKAKFQAKQTDTDRDAWLKLHKVTLDMNNCLVAHGIAFQDGDNNVLSLDERLGSRLKAVAVENPNPFADYDLLTYESVLPAETIKVVTMPPGKRTGRIDYDRLKKIGVDFSAVRHKRLNEQPGGDTVWVSDNGPINLAGVLTGTSAQMGLELKTKINAPTFPGKGGQALTHDDRLQIDAYIEEIAPALEALVSAVSKSGVPLEEILADVFRSNGFNVVGSEKMAEWAVEEIELRSQMGNLAPQIALVPINMMEERSYAHYACLPCINRRAAEEMVDEIIDPMQTMCCYCSDFKLQDCWPIMDMSEDRPGCKHGGELAELSAEATRRHVAKEQLDDSKKELVALLTQQSGRDITEVVDLNDPAELDNLARDITTDGELKDAVLRMIAISRDVPELKKKLEQLRTRFYNHRHVMCTECFEIGRPADETPQRNPQSGVPYGACCYCGKRTRCDIMNTELPDSQPQYCYIENRTNPVDYHGVCQDCWPTVTTTMQIPLNPIYQRQYDFNLCCVCHRSKHDVEILTYAVNPKGKADNQYSTLCAEVHFTNALHIKKRKPKMLSKQARGAYRWWRGLVNGRW